VNLTNLPRVGEPLEGGTFAGIITGRDGAHSAVVLLDDKPADRVTWQQAMEWAASLHAELPTRPVAALLYANLRARFEEAWHWTSEDVEGYGSHAWLQHFHDGNQYNYRKGYEGRARAVRLIPLEPAP